MRRGPVTPSAKQSWFANLFRRQSVALAADLMPSEEQKDRPAVSYTGKNVREAMEGLQQVRTAAAAAAARLSGFLTSSSAPCVQSLGALGVQWRLIKSASGVVQYECDASCHVDAEKNLVVVNTATPGAATVIKLVQGGHAATSPAEGAHAAGPTPVAAAGAPTEAGTPRRFNYAADGTSQPRTLLFGPQTPTTPGGAEPYSPMPSRSAATALQPVRFTVKLTTAQQPTMEPAAAAGPTASVTAIQFNHLLGHPALYRGLFSEIVGRVI